MDKAARARWVAKGFPDPVIAYHQQAVSANRRGIEFDLTFEQWWALWEPHYSERGRAAGQKCMCRTGDEGPYEVGNVRIDTVQGNAIDRAQSVRARNIARGRLASAEDRVALPHQAADDEWIVRRSHVFKPYTEDEEAE